MNMDMMGEKAFLVVFYDVSAGERRYRLFREQTKAIEYVRNETVWDDHSSDAELVEFDAWARSPFSHPFCTGKHGWEQWSLARLTIE